VLTAIKTASLSGIDVQIIFPHQPDSYIVHAASMSYMKEMLEAGVKVHLYTKGFIHAKTLLVDDVFSSVGTANMDYRNLCQTIRKSIFRRCGAMCAIATKPVGAKTY